MMLANSVVEPEEDKLLKNLSENLTSLLKEHHINETELARQLNITYNTIHRLVNGNTSDPKLSTLQAIADYFKVSLDYLLSSHTNHQACDVDKPRFVPLLTWEQIQSVEFTRGFGSEASADWIPIVTNEKNLITDYCYALESTRSMFPRFPLGATFIVKFNEPPIDGDLVIIRFKKDRTVSLRELIVDSPDWQLLPVITGSKSLLYDKNEIELIGVVILTLIQARAS